MLCVSVCGDGCVWWCEGVVMGVCGDGCVWWWVCVVMWGCGDGCVWWCEGVMYVPSTLKPAVEDLRHSPQHSIASRRWYGDVVHTEWGCEGVNLVRVWGCEFREGVSWVKVSNLSRWRSLTLTPDSCSNSSIELTHTIWHMTITWHYITTMNSDLREIFRGPDWNGGSPVSVPGHGPVTSVSQPVRKPLSLHKLWDPEKFWTGQWKIWMGDVKFWVGCEKFELWDVKLNGCEWKCEIFEWEMWMEM